MLVKTISSPRESYVRDCIPTAALEYGDLTVWRFPMAKMIYRTLEIMPFGTNCYLVASERTRDGMVIDPAGDAPRILSNIHELDLKIGLIVATHTHPDHIGAVGHVVEYTGASFAVHTAEAEIMQRYDFSQFTAYDPTFKQPPLPSRLLKDGDFLVLET
jgi:glyoxylase-like metal-dependent hydrolase (beta-lactamase superfamily II)